MANAISYMKNLGKSITYSSIDTFKQLNPVVTSFYQTNEDIFRDSYRAIKNIKETAKTGYTKAMESPVTGLAKGYYDNLIDDLKSGRFYNKERIRRDEDAAAADYVGGDDFGFEDFDFGDDDSFSMGTTNSKEDNSGDLGLGFDDLDTVAEKSTNAVGMVMARSAQYQVEAQRQSTKILYDQNNAIFGQMHG